MNQNENIEFLNIITPITNHNKFLQLKKIKHHGDNRYDHCLRVAYHTYIVTKKLHLNYKKATEAALLHDFFTTEVQNENSLARLRRHPSHALENASKYFELDNMQKDIIKTHMFPVTFTPPKYLESWIVDIIDDLVALYEKGYYLKREAINTSLIIVFMIIQYFELY